MDGGAFLLPLCFLLSSPLPPLLFSRLTHRTLTHVNLPFLFLRWTVNLRFLPEPVFASPALSLSLLATHAALLAAFACTRWVDGEAGGLPGVAARFWARGFGATRIVTARTTRAATSKAAPPRPPPGPTLALLATGNLVGIAAARSLHYQFYAWYAQSLPLLLWGVDVEGVVGRVVGGRKGRARPNPAVRAAAACIRLGAWAGVEAAWNVYPATPASSGLLTALHVLVVVGLAWAPAGWTRVGGGGGGGGARGEGRVS